MPSALDLISLPQQIYELARHNARGWMIFAPPPKSLCVHVNLMPAGSSDLYCLRIDFGDSLSRGPPSVVFCAPGTFEEGRPQDWPRGMTEHFVAPSGRDPVGWIRNPWTREGRRDHQEWHALGWSPKGALWTVISAVQTILDSPGAYTERAI